MALRTTAFERAGKLGWSIPELARRSLLSEETLYKLRSGERSAGPKVIEGLLRAFPNLGYRDLFVPDDGTPVQMPRTPAQDSVLRPAGEPAEVAAA